MWLFISKDADKNKKGVNNNCQLFCFFILIEIAE